MFNVKIIKIFDAKHENILECLSGGGGGGASVPVCAGEDLVSATVGPGGGPVPVSAPTVHVAAGGRSPERQHQRSVRAASASESQSHDIRVSSSRQRRQK